MLCDGDLCLLTYVCCLLVIACRLMCCVGWSLFCVCCLLFVGIVFCCCSLGVGCVLCVVACCCLLRDIRRCWLMFLGCFSLVVVFLVVARFLPLVVCSCVLCVVGCLLCVDD